MIGETEAMVVDVRRLDVHGVVYVDVAVRRSDGATDSARLGAEGVPDDLRPGERVLVTNVANIIVAIRRRPGED